MITQIHISEIETGDCLAWHGFSILAKEVQKFQSKCYPDYAATWNHIGIFYRVQDLLMVSEARLGGVLPCNFKSYENDLKEHPESKALCLKPKFKINPGKIEHLANEHYGMTKYDIINLAGFQVIRTITKNHIWLGGKKVDEKFICGEWGAHNYNEFTDFWDNEKRIAPADFILMNCFNQYEIIL